MRWKCQEEDVGVPAVGQWVETPTAGAQVPAEVQVQFLTRPSG